jgi:molybdopterin converting factor small subunit
MNAETAPVDVRLPHLLAHLFPDAPRRLSLDAHDVSALIDALDERWPGMGDCLRDTSPAVRRHINIFVDGKRASLGTKLAPGTDVFILTAISGG